MFVTTACSVAGKAEVVAFAATAGVFAMTEFRKLASLYSGVVTEPSGEVTIFGRPRASWAVVVVNESGSSAGAPFQSGVFLKSTQTSRLVERRLPFSS